jgi:cell division protein FtsB
MLELAKRYAEQAEKLPSGDDKRNWLEEEAKRLIEGARALTEQAKSEVSKTT